MKVEMKYFKDTGELIGSNMLDLRPNPNQEIQDLFLMEGDTATVLLPTIRLNFQLPKEAAGCGCPECCTVQGWDEW